MIRWLDFGYTKDDIKFDLSQQYNIKNNLIILDQMLYLLEFHSRCRSEVNF